MGFIDWIFEKVFSRIGGIIAAVAVIAIVLCLFLFSRTVYFVDNYELGYKFDTRTGETTILPRTGYFVVLPILVKVHTIDLRPVQVCVSSNRRVLNCKLVKFNPEGIKLFLEWHGRRDYQMSPADRSATGTERANDSKPIYLDDILMAYAYEGAGHTYPFLAVMREMDTSDADPEPSVLDNFEIPAPPTPSVDEVKLEEAAE